MADKDLKLRISLDLDVYKKGMLDAIKIGKITSTTLQNIFSKTDVELNTDDIERQFNTITKTGEKLSTKLKKPINPPKIKFSHNIDNVMEKLATMNLAVEGAKKIFRGVSAVSKPFNSYEVGLANVATLTGMSRDAMFAMGEELIVMSKKYGKSVDELADSMYQSVSAGFSVAESLQLVGSTTKGAIAGITDTKTAIDGATTIMNAYGLDITEVDNVMDTFFKTVEKGKTTFPELASSISIVAPLAATMGISFDEVGAALASITKQGTPTSQAVTQIRASIISANEILEDGWADAMTYQEAMNLIAESAGGSEKKLKELVGRVEAMNGILAITGKKSSEAGEDLEAMYNKAGAAQKAFEIQAQTAQFEIDQITQKFKNLSIKVMTNFGKAYTHILDSVSKLVDYIAQNGESIVIMLSSIAGGFIAIKIAAIASSIAAGIAAGSITLAGAAMNAALFGIPILIGLIINWLVKFEKRAGKITEFFSNLKTFVSNAIDYISLSLRAFFEKVRVLFNGFLTFMLNIGRLVLKALLLPYTLAYNQIKIFVEGIGKLWKALVSGDLKDALSNIADNSKNAFTAAIEAIKDEAATLADPFIEAQQKIAAIEAELMLKRTQINQETKTDAEATGKATVSTAQKTATEQDTILAEMVEYAKSKQQGLITYKQNLDVGYYYSKSQQDKDLFDALVQQASFYTGVAADAADNVVQIFSAAHSMELNALRKTNDYKKSTAERQEVLEHNLAMKNQKRIIALFNIKKAANAATALVETGRAVMEVAPNAPLMISMGLAGAAQVANILATQAPELEGFEKGGFPFGKNRQVVVNEAGQETIVPAKPTRVLGLPLMRWLMDNPEAAREKLLGSMQYSPALATVGLATAQANISAPYAQDVEHGTDAADGKMDILIQEVISLKNIVKELRLRVTAREVFLLSKTGELSVGKGNLDE